MSGYRIPEVFDDYDPAPVAAEGTDELREALIAALYDVAVDHPMWIDNQGRGLDYNPERESRIGGFLEDAADALLAGPVAPLRAVATITQEAQRDGCLVDPDEIRRALDAR